MNTRISRWLALIGVGLPKNPTIPFESAPCVLHKTHDPRPSTLELHHVFPVFLQAKVWETVDPRNPATAKDKEKLAVCGDGHTDVHVAITAMLEDRPIPRGVGITEKHLALEAIKRFNAARQAKGRGQ